jgi:hypothetical protein
MPLLSLAIDSCRHVSCAFEIRLQRRLTECQLFLNKGKREESILRVFKELQKFGTHIIITETDIKHSWLFYIIHHFTYAAHHNNSQVF